jgi:hypothetical protein
MVSDMRNLHSQRVYVVSTAPEQGQDFWTTAVLPTVEKRRFFGLSTRTEVDVYHPIINIIRNNRDDALQAHVLVRNIVLNWPEDKWFDAWPSPRPPQGYSPGARAKMLALGVDPDS